MKQNILRWGACFVALCFVAKVANNQLKTTRSSQSQKHGEKAPIGPDEFQSLEGFWLGGLREDLRLLFRFKSSPDQQVFTYSLDQGGGLIPATASTFDPNTKEFVFYFDQVNGYYKAKLSGSKLIGTWKQRGRSISLVLDRQDAAVPREFRFLMEKATTGSPEDLVTMEGYWSGYLDDSSDKEEKEPPTRVIFQVEKIANDLVEAKLFLPDEQRLPVGVRSLSLFHEQVKIVVDDPLDESNAIFQGKVEKGKNIIGVVKYDDTDYTPSLSLVWSAERPPDTLEQTAA